DSCDLTRCVNSRSEAHSLASASPPKPCVKCEVLHTLTGGSRANVMMRQQQWKGDMRLILAATGIVLCMAVRLPASAKQLWVFRTQLSGEWLSDDGGTYRVRRNAGNVIWWVGESSDGGRTFTNVFKGIYDPRTNLITGDWSDVRTNFGRIGSGSLT